jgi:signal recognition particle subunit SEC65
MMLDAFDRRIRAKFSDVVRTREDMHDYQIAKAVPFLKENPLSALFVDLGLGKTVICLTVIADILAELDYDGPTLVIGPMRVATQTWPNEIREWAHTAHLSHSLIHVSDDHPAVVDAARQARSKARLEGKGQGEATTAGNAAAMACKQRLRAAATCSRAPLHIIPANWVEWLVEYWGPKWPYRIVFIDECFVAGTLISTPTGDRTIESLKTGDLVKTPYGDRPIKCVLQKLTTRCIKITLSNGRVIECTPNHRFLTDIGWLEAGQLQDRIVYDESDSTTLRVRALWGDVLDMEVSPEILQSIVQNEKSVVKRSRKDAEGGGSCQQGESESGSLEQGLALVRRSQGKTSCEQKQGHLHASTRWERKWNDEARGNVGDSVDRRLAARVRDFARRSYSWLSDLLQSRLCLARAKNLPGSRWFKSFVAESESPRREEDRDVGFARVVSVENYESTGGTSVFDLSVDGAPFYYAGGCLVHNCSMFKDYSTNRFKALAKVRSHPGLIERMHLLTATPAAESYLHLFAQIFLIDGGKRFGKKVTPFQDEFFTQCRYTRKFKLRPNAEPQILEKIADICLVMKGDEYLKLQEPQIIRRPIRMSEGEMALYTKLETDFVVTLPDGSEVEAETAVALSQKLQQMASGVLYETYLDEDLETQDFKKVKKVHHIHDQKIEELQQLVEESQGEPILVAYHWQASLARLKKAFPKAVVMDREGKCVKPWNAGKIPMLLMHPKSGGHGLNLQKGGHILAIYDLFYSLELFLQLVGRLARQGQTHPVLVYMFTTVGTIDEVVAKSLQEKEDAQEKMFRILRKLIKKFHKQREEDADTL